MAGKWEKLKGKFEQKPFEDPRFAEKVDAARANYAALSLKDLLFHLNDRDHQKDELNDQIKELNVELEALGQLIKTHFEGMDVHSVQTDFGRTVYLHTEPSVGDDGTGRFDAFVKADPSLDYLRTVNAQTRKTFAKGYLEQEDFTADKLPPGLKIFWDVQVRIRKT